MAMNYGVDKVRFPSPVHVGSRIRAGAELIEVTDVKGGGIQTKMLITIEIEGRRSLLRDRVARALDPLMTATGAARPCGQGRQAAQQDRDVARGDRRVPPRKHTMSFATMNRDGSIHMVAMWYGFLEGGIAFESKAKAQKVLNLRRNPTIT